MDSVFMQRAMSGSLPVKVVGGTPIEPHIPRPAMLEPIHITVASADDIALRRLAALFAVPA